MPVAAAFAFVLFGNITAAMPPVTAASTVRLAALGSSFSVSVGFWLIVVGRTFVVVGRRRGRTWSGSWARNQSWRVRCEGAGRIGDTGRRAVIWRGRGLPVNRRRRRSRGCGCEHGIVDDGAAR